MADIRILYRPVSTFVNIFDDVALDARFVGVAGGNSGEANLRVRDKEHAYPPGYFVPGKQLQLEVDGDVVWDGWILVVEEQYAFDVDDTTDPEGVARYWVLQGYDRNILWSRRYFFDQDNPEATDIGNYPAGAIDSVVVKDILDRLSSLGSDGLDIVSGIETVAEIDPYEDIRVGNMGQELGVVMNKIILFNGAVYYIDPARVVRYHDDVTETAPFQLSDTPGPGQVGYREGIVRSVGDKLQNDAFIWGVGLGSPQAVFSRAFDQDSIDLHGRLQFGERFEGMWRQQSVDRRSDTFINGSPSHRRGHKDPVNRIECVIFTPGLVAGMGVRFEFAAYDGIYDDVYPLRRVEMTFPTPSSVRYALRLSHEMDAAWAFMDPPPDDGLSDDWVTEHIDPGPISAPWTSFDGDFIDEYAFEEDGAEHLGVLLKQLSGTIATPPASGYMVDSWVGTGTVPFFESYCPGVLGGIYDYKHAEGWWRLVNPFSIDQMHQFLTGERNLDWFAIRIRITNVVYTGAASGFSVRTIIAPRLFDDAADYVDNAQKSGTLLTTVTSSRTESSGTSPAETDVVDVMISGEQFRAICESFVDLEGNTLPTAGRLALWVLVDPGWESVRVDAVSHICLLYVTHPKVSGVGNSGSLESINISSEWMSNYSFERSLGSYQEGDPMWSPLDRLYYTSYPYVPGTLQVGLGGVSMSGLVLASGGPGATGVMNVAAAQLGKPYVLGTEGPSTFDCSGLVYFCFVQTGQVDLIGGTRRRARGYRNWFIAQGRYTTSRETGMVPGSLVIYGTDAEHIGIYIGNGKVISALNPTQGIVVHGIDSLTNEVHGFCLPDYGGTSGDTTDYGDADDSAPTMLTPISGVDFQEVDPAAGSFRVTTTDASLSMGMTVTYVRAVGATATPVPGTTSGMPVDHGGVTYRPRGQRQLGWGTEWDGHNCGMTTAAMSLDRHTLGAFSDIIGYPRSIPPNMRNFSGNMALSGTSLQDAVKAWTNGWGETLLYTGYSSWDYFVTQIQNGRGAMASGLYSAMPLYLKKDADFNGGHSIYINEVLSDGSFWGYDPLTRAPQVYPATVLRTYMQALTGSSHVAAAYTRVTPRVA